ncbi:MAG TPA: o-succinylbenzoate synthase [Pseudolysinimonas sp.]|nr:o-succinylbenzoate synthase [Pseudolysinimonas sp.]
MSELPETAELLAGAHVLALPMRQRFRGIEVREVMVLRGPQGWTEFSPFVEYDDAESAAWLAAAIDFGWKAAPAPLRDRIPVNATLPAVPADRVAEVLARFPGCRTVKVKVAEPGQALADDVARVAAARTALGPEGRIRLDANGGWNVDEAEHAVHALAPFDLEYLEQPCASVAELAELRERIGYLGIPVAADESVRKADDPLAVARAGAADLLVIKAQPLGGIHRALGIVRQAGLPVNVSSALETSIGIAMGAHLAAALPELPYDCGLATVALFERDIAADPLLPVDGAIPVRRPEPDARALTGLAASPERDAWWRDRLRRCRELLET